MGSGTRHRIVLVEDHTLFREGLKALLSLEPDFEIVGEAEDGLKAIQCVQRFKPDIVLLDLTMPRLNGMEAIREMKKISPKTKVVVLTAHSSQEFVAATLRGGASGYVLKDADHAELLLAMRSVLKDKRYLSPDVSGGVIDRYLDGAKAQDPDSPWETLTARERQVLKLIAEGCKSKEIADVLCISEDTVAKHRAHIMTKLDLHSAPALTAYALKKGLIRE
jgi:two-component system, NarL family, response regulator NreC